MFGKKLFRHRNNESRKRRDGRDGQYTAPRESSSPSSRVSSRGNCKSPPFDVTSKTAHEKNLRRILGQFAIMSELAEDVGILLREAKEKLEMLHKIDGSLFGRGKIGTYVNRCKKHLVKSQNINREIDEYIKNEEKDLKEEGPMQGEGNVKAHDDLLKEVQRSSPETWKTGRTMGEIENDLGLIITRYDELLKSDNCKSQCKRKVLQELISESVKLKATHERARSILAIDNPPTQSRGPRGGARDPIPVNTSKVTPHPRRPGPRSS
ncbi:hypothetical protein BCON_0003g00200 [Botryotinia convoluta]|uniref:Uncharacterized protein n=1 Tax=Botryotinia convoluta TaxID=54673 RepID=A0A4Z1J8G8_9HELO|nr:hypothetical protein BCON_0003g00200 [Botryotinia convoluta]